MRNLEKYNINDTLHVIKENKTEVYYYLFDEYEIHLNKIPSHSTQELHYHNQIEEVILVTKGKLKCLWIENGQKHSQTIHENELVLVKQSIHTLTNDSHEDCEFVVFRLVLEGKNKRDIMKEDKIVVKNINEL